MEAIKKNDLPGCPPVEGLQEFACPDYTTSLQNLQTEIEQKFVSKKEQTDVLGAIYTVLEDEKNAGNLNYDKKSAYFDYESKFHRVLECGTFLEFKVTPNNQKLQHANFCKDRLCPMCNWRRSLKIFSQVSKVMNVLGDDYKYLFLTLTVKNCTSDELPRTVQVLYDAWRYLYNKNKEFKTLILGSFRSLEITRNKYDGTFHPHLHCILVVRKSYGKKKGKYIDHDRWTELWRNACDLDYNPIVHIQKIKDNGKGIAGAVSEVTKYAVKGSDYLNGNDIDESAQFVLALLDAISGRRLCGWTGLFAKIRKQLNLDDAENGDLVITDDDTIREDVACMIVRYQWKNGFYERSFKDKFVSKIDIFK